MGAVFWAISTAIFGILEIIIPGIVTIWLALASLILTILTLFFTNVSIEFLIFSILSMVFIIFTRPVLQKYMEKNKIDFDSKFIGQEVEIDKILDIRNNKKIYEVKFKGTFWTGVSEEVFSLGEKVKIKEFEGNKIILSKI